MTAPTKPTLYDLLGVPTTASFAEIKKAYHQRALATHPDKQTTEQARKEAASSFTVIQRAYEILSNEAKRKAYDLSGFKTEDFEDFDAFTAAYEFYRHLFPRVTPKDITAFETRYRGSAEEEKDLLDYFKKKKGDISDLLENIPVSRPEDVDRFVTFFRAQMAADLESPGDKKFEASVKKLQLQAKRMQKEISRNSPGQQAELMEAIMGKRKEREDAMAGFFADIEARYTKKAKKTLPSNFEAPDSPTLKRNTRSRKQ